MQMFKIEANGLIQLREALSQAALPFDDVSDPGRQFFRFEMDGKWIAYGGLEGGGQDLLLRSLVVCELHRGEGLGKAVLSELERYAASHGALRLHLLTQSATGFFTTNGYEIFDRDEAPLPIRQTAQFKHLCPASATYLRKSLDTMMVSE